MPLAGGEDGGLAGGRAGGAEACARAAAGAGWAAEAAGAGATEAVPRGGTEADRRGAETAFGTAETRPSGAPCGGVGVRGALALCVKGTLAKGGLLSFIMFVIATDNRVGEDWREVIELMHLVLFVTVVLYLVQVGVLASIRNGIVREWQAAAATWGNAPPQRPGRWHRRRRHF